MKTTPFGKSSLVDPLRAGGGLSLRRHSFLGQDEAPAEEYPMTPNVSSEELLSIRSAIQSFFEEASEQMAQVLTEASLALDLDNSDFAGFSSRAEFLGQAQKDAAAVDDFVQEFSRGAVSPYMTATDVASAAEISKFRTDVDETAAAAPFTSKEPLDLSRSKEYVDSHLDSLKVFSREAEEVLVTAEASGVPVLEPLEKQDNDLPPLIGLGLLAVAAYALYEYLS